MALERCSEGMHRFRMIRQHDVSGVSGTGVVLEGIVFSSGQCVTHFLTPGPRGSVTVWDSFESFESVHISSHQENETIIQWLHDEKEEEEER